MVLKMKEDVTQPFDLYIDGKRPNQLVSEITEIFSCRIIQAINQIRTGKTKQICNATSIQAGLWPGVRDDLSVMAISGPQRGKTLGWMLPLLDKLMPGSESEHIYADLPDEGLSPYCVVLAPYQKDVQEIAETLLQLISGAESEKYIRVGQLHKNMTDVEAMISLCNSCDILVATPSSLKRYLIDYGQYANGLQCINFVRTCHLVIETAHITLSLFPQEISSLLQEFASPHHDTKPLLPNKMEPRKVQQLVVISELWNTAVKEFAEQNRLDKVLISDMLEAVLFKKIAIIPALVKCYQSKMDVVLKVLKREETRYQKIFFCCKDIPTGKTIEGLLFSEGFNPIIFSEEDTFYDDISRKYEGGNDLYIITDSFTDTALQHVKNIFSGSILIHWDLPDKEARVFKERFGLIKNANPTTAQIYLFISDQNYLQARDLQTLISRTGVEIPSDLAAFLDDSLKSRRKYEVENEHPLCPILVTTGSCRGELDNCTKRHTLKKVKLSQDESLSIDQLNYEHRDTNPSRFLERLSGDIIFQGADKEETDDCSSISSLSDSLLSSVSDRTSCYGSSSETPEEREFDTVGDEVRFNVLKVETPVMYWIKIQDDVDGDLQQDLPLRLAMFFSKPSNRITVEECDVEVGCVCAVMDSINSMFSRSRIENIIRKKIGFWEYIHQVTVRGLDTGDLHTVYSSNLFYLPEEFAAVKPLAVLAVVAGLEPKDSDLDWDRESTRNIDIQLRKDSVQVQQQVAICRAKLILRTDEILWLENCEYWKKIPGFSKLICQFNVVAYLTKEIKVAERNPTHFLRIRELGEQSGYQIPRLLQFKSMCHSIGQFDQIQQQEGNVRVVLLDCFSPHFFILQRFSTLDSKADLQENLVRYLETSPASLVVGGGVRLGDYLVVLHHEDQQPERARVIRADKQTGSYLVYLLDQGSTQTIHPDQVWPLPPRHLFYPKFFGIPCRLQGIIPPQEGLRGWSAAAGDALFDATRYADTDYPIPLDCGAAGKPLPPQLASSSLPPVSSYIHDSLLGVIPLPQLVNLALPLEHTNADESTKHQKVDLSEMLVDIGEAVTSRNKSKEDATYEQWIDCLEDQFWKDELFVEDNIEHLIDCVDTEECSDDNLQEKMNKVKYLLYQDSSI